MVNDSATGDSPIVFLNHFDGNDYNFKIPPHLLESYGPVLPSKASLRVDDSGKKWRVTIEKFKDVYFFTNGWKEFAEQVDLKSLDWLKFKSCSFSKQTGTNKEKTDNVSVTRSCIQSENKGKCSRVETTLSFTKKMKYYHRYGMDISKNYASRIGKDRNIRIKDGEGREWPVHVIEKADGVLSTRRGWTDFVVANKLMVGSTISFTWLSTNMLQTQIVDAGTKQPLFSTGKKSRYTKGNHLQNPDSS